MERRCCGTASTLTLRPSAAPRWPPPAGAVQCRGRAHLRRAHLRRDRHRQVPARQVTALCVGACYVHPHTRHIHELLVGLKLPQACSGMGPVQPTGMTTSCRPTHLPVLSAAAVYAAVLANTQLAFLVAAYSICKASAPIWYPALQTEASATPEHKATRRAPGQHLTAAQRRGPQHLRTSGASFVADRYHAVGKKKYT